MGQLARRVITDIQKDDFDDAWIAGDLLYKLKSKNYCSGVDFIDTEIITQEKGEKLKEALVEAIQRTDNVDILGSLIWTLGKSYDPSFKRLYIEYLIKFVTSGKASNHALYQTLIALENIGEDVFNKQETSQGSLNIEKNFKQAEKYLTKQNNIGHSTNHNR
jgi:hypothetical protein